MTHFKRAYQIGIKHLKYSNEGKLLLLQEHWDFKELLLITFIKIITLYDNNILHDTLTH